MSYPLVGLAGLGGSQLLSVLVVADTGRGSTVAAAFTGTDTVIKSVLLLIGA